MSQKNINQLITAVLKKNNDWKIQLLRDWPTIIGHLHDKVSVEKVLDDTLILGVTDSCWLQELYMLSHVLLRTINQKLDQPRIKQLRFKKSGSKKIKKKTVKQQKKPQKAITLTSYELKKAAQCNDKHLGEALKKYLIRCYGERTDEHNKESG